jgi:formate dehydrogenase
MLRTIFDEGLEDRGAIARTPTGIESLRAIVATDTFTAGEAERRSGVPAEAIRKLARDLAAAPSAAVYGRIGTCRGRHGTLTVYLLDALNIVTGNFDRPGGSLIGQEFTPGAGQLRAFFTVGGNPVLSVPNPVELEAALTALDLVVSIDLYVSETGRYADYVLPSTTFVEKHDVPLQFLTNHTRPFAVATEPVLAPRGETRDEWEIIDAIARRVGVAPYSDPIMRALARVGIRPKPRTLVDAALRLGPQGDRYGLRRKGLSLAKLAKLPDGIVLGEHQETGVQRERLRHKDGLVHLDAPPIADEARRLGNRHGDDPNFPLSLITLRELRSHNSWMHNVPKLVVGRGHSARIHPNDAAELGIADGDAVRIRSRTGSIETAALVTDEIIHGTIAVPHGWGHREAGWQLANRVAGPNVNALASTDLDDLERVAGMTLLDGIPVRLEPVRVRIEAEAVAATA